MAGDVVLDGDRVVIQGQYAKLEALDLMLDAASRRIEQSGHRRALVHDHGDRLTLNWGGDYPNGVNIVGQTSADSLYVKQRGKFGQGVVTPKLLLGPATPPPAYDPSGGPTGAGEWGIDVGSAISSLQEQIAVLTRAIDEVKTEIAELRQ